MDYCQVVITLLTLRYHPNISDQCQYLCPSLARQSVLFLSLNIRCSPHYQKKLSTLHIEDKLIIYQNPWDVRLIINFLEGKLTRLSSLILRFLVSISQTICKTYLCLLYYIITKVASWSWCSITKKPSLLHLASRASCLIIFLKGLTSVLMRLQID